MIPYLGCQGAREMLEAFVDGELPVSEQVALEAHLRWCETCRARIEDLQLIGSALRQGSASASGHTEIAVLATRHDEVVTRVQTERDQSLTVRWRELFTDMRYLWPAIGATLAVALCISALTTLVTQIVRTERSDSLAALISTMANPGSDENPLHLESGMLVPRIFEVGPALESMPEEEAVYAVAAVVTREGRVSNYELLQSQSVHEPLADSGTLQIDEVTAVLDAVRYSRFEPAQTADGVVAVNMVWVLARTTVKASANAKPDEGDSGTLSAVPARPAPRPARS